jgi:hypothetical protein
VKPAAPLSSGQLKERLLDTADLGEGYTPKPERPAGHDDMTVVGCPALQKLGGDAAAGGTLDFPHRAKASFTYTGGTDSEVTEELYSDTETKLSAGTRQIFHAMGSCPTYQVTDGSTPIEITTQKAHVAKKGEERWATFSPSPSPDAAASPSRRPYGQATPSWSSPAPPAWSTPT